MTGESLDSKNTFISALKCGAFGLFLSKEQKNDSAEAKAEEKKAA